MPSDRKKKNRQRAKKRRTEASASASASASSSAASSSSSSAAASAAAATKVVVDDWDDDDEKMSGQFNISTGGGGGGNDSNDDNDDGGIKEASEWLKSLKITDIISPSVFSDADARRPEFRAARPFPYLQLSSFMDDAFLRQVREELKTHQFYLRSTDLNDFHQTHDLKACTTPLVSKLRECLYSGEFRDALQRMTGIEVAPLTDDVAMACAVYGKGNHLLPHDDELEGRRIAYVLYLVDESWSAADGGLLQLFSSDEQCTPTSVATSVVPQWNSLMFFEVSQRSWHMVSEVLKDDHRMSIHGWFHGKPFDRPIARAVVTAPPMRAINVDDDDADADATEAWVNRTYRKSNIQKQVRKQFADESSIELVDFLRKDAYKALVAEIAAAAASSSCSNSSVNGGDWVVVGPPHMRRYEQIVSASSPYMARLQKFVVSSDFAALLEMLCGVEVVRGRSEYRRFDAGSYTIGHDKDMEAQDPGVDIILTCLPPRAADWQDEHGGLQHYFDTTGDASDIEPLLTIYPKPNTLSIVYRGEPGTCRFTKYVNHSAPYPAIDLACVYRTSDDDDDDDDENE